MSLMLETPANYSGEFEHAALSEVSRRTWYFDLSSGHLIYRPGRPLAWLDRDDDIESPEFEVQVAFEDRDGDHVYEPYRDELHGVRLARVAGFAWLEGSAQARN
jgi:hypothetical protein